MAFIDISWQIFWLKFFRNVPWAVLYETYHFVQISANISIILASTKILLPLLCFRYYGNLKFPLTYNGKSENGIHCYLTADILTKVLQKCSLSGPLPNSSFLSSPLNLICCHGNRKDKFPKMFIALAFTKIVLFIAVADVLSLLWQLIVSIWKVKNSIYCYLIADILTRVLQKWLLSGPPPNMSF